MISKFFIWRLKMDTSIFSLVIMRFLVVHDHTLRWRMKDAHRDEAGGVRTTIAMHCGGKIFVGYMLCFSIDIVLSLDRFSQFHKLIFV